MVAKLMNIMIAANQYQIDVNDILQRFETEIDSFAQQRPSADMCNQQVLSERSARFSYELSYYYLYRGMYNDGFKYLMNALLKANILNNETYFINCMGLFARFQAHAVPETKAEFFNLVERVWINNVEKNGIADRRN